MEKLMRGQRNEGMAWRDDLGVATAQRTGKDYTIVAVLAMLLLALSASAEVPIDRIPNTLTLPERYPDSWVFVYAVSQPILGSYAIVDVAAGTKEYKGQFQGAFYPFLVDPVAGGNLYVAESFFESGSHGKRNDVLTITQKATLDPIAQIVLPGMKRAIVEGNLMDITRDGKFMLVLNFTPASSVTVVDIEKRRVVNEVPIPGCTSIYRSGARGFTSLCADGTLVALSLGDKGQVLHESHSASFNDIDSDVLYLQPTSVGATTYFVSEKGSVLSIDMTGDEPTVLPRWGLMTTEEAADGWRTADGTFVASDERGRLYVRLHRETGYDRQVRDNTEVWVYDASEHKRVGRIPLKNGGSSIDVTRGPKPYLVVVDESDPNSGGEGVDVYDAMTGEFQRTIGGWPQGTFIVLSQARR